MYISYAFLPCTADMSHLEVPSIFLILEFREPTCEASWFPLLLLLLSREEKRRWHSPGILSWDMVLGCPEPTHIKASSSELCAGQSAERDRTEAHGDAQGAPAAPAPLWSSLPSPAPAMRVKHPLRWSQSRSAPTTAARETPERLPCLSWIPDP